MEAKGAGTLWIHALGATRLDPDRHRADMVNPVADPNELVQPLHDRMPVILAPSDYDRLLESEIQSGHR